MELILHMLHYLVSFLVVISVIVFIHEFGHYFVARCCGVKIEAFSIGFGKKIWGWRDRHGTQWKISLLPLGGYVKMFGDASAISNADTAALSRMKAAERRGAFHFKPLWQKALVVVAGPAANFLLTVAIFTWFIMTVGLSSTEPVVGQVVPGSPAAEAGLQSGDRITDIGGQKVRRFADIPLMIAANLGTPLLLTFERGKAVKHVVLTPREYEDDDGFGNKVRHPLIGIRSKEVKFQEVGLPRAVWESVKRTYDICGTTLQVLGQIVTGERTAKEIKGPVGIAQLSAQATDKGLNTVLWLVALLSANLGLVNLMPVPVLDGGHLLYYAVEAARGRPLAQKVQEYGFRIGFALVVTLMAFTIFNDVRQLLF